MCLVGATESHYGATTFMFVVENDRICRESTVSVGGGGRVSAKAMQRPVPAAVIQRRTRQSLVSTMPAQCFIRPSIRRSPRYAVHSAQVHSALTWFSPPVETVARAIVSPPASSSSSLPPTNSDTPSASPLPSSSFSSTAPAAAVQTAVSHITNPNTTTDITSPTSPDTTDEDQDYTCPHCDRTFTSHIGLVGHLRIHRTETGEPVPGAPTYTHRTRLHCPHCPRTFRHRMGLFGHMRIHESGIDRSLDTPTPPSPTTNPPPCVPTNHSPTDIDASGLTTSHSSPSSSSSITATTTTASASVAHDFTTAEPGTTTGTKPATSIIRREGQDYICPHCDRTFTSRIGLVGHLRIHRTETGEPVPGAPTYTHRTRLHCPHCPRTFTHRMGLFGHMRIHDDLR
nr:unnamed protein product [Spirometra erinaceieuropaei]